MLKRMLRNWKTTAAGVVGICGGIGTIGAGISKAVEGDFAAALPLLTAGAGAIATGFGLLFAKDANVTGGTVPNAT